MKPSCPAPRKGVIPAAGLGTRLLPAAKAVPKEMMPILDRPALQWIVEEARAAGVEEIIIVTSAGKEALQKHFAPNPELIRRLNTTGKQDLAARLTDLETLGRRIRFVTQPEQKGLGDAILCAAAAVGNEPFHILLGDALIHAAVPAAEQLRRAFLACGGNSVIGLQTVAPDRVSRYGIVAGEWCGDRLYRLRRLVEKPTPDQAPSNLAISGRYLATAGLFRHLRELRPGKDGEIQVTDAFNALLQEEPVYGYLYEGERHDLGNPLDYFDAAVAYALEIPAYRAKLDGRLDRLAALAKTAAKD